MSNKDYKNKYEDCDHKWVPLFHKDVDKTETTMRIAVGILCIECGMFRTKILEFRYPKSIRGINES